MKNFDTSPFDMYKNVLDTHKSYSATNKGFRPYNNTMYSYTEEKAGFADKYYKRKVLDNGVDTVPLDIDICPDLTCTPIFIESEQHIPISDENDNDNSSQDDTAAGLLYTQFIM